MISVKVFEPGLYEFAMKNPATEKEIEEALKRLEQMRGGTYVQDRVSGTDEEEVQGQDHERTCQEAVLSEVSVRAD